MLNESTIIWLVEELDIGNGVSMREAIEHLECTYLGLLGFNPSMIKTVCPEGATLLSDIVACLAAGQAFEHVRAQSALSS